MTATPASPRRVVLHLDIDAFFCQVEEKKRGVAPGTPVAIQQHQDIIAANYPARAAGVKKHMRPAEARRILHAANGMILPVHMEAGQRVSYGPYRAVSRAMIKLLSSFGEVAVVEKASIDEAFMQLKPQQPGGSDTPLAEHSQRVAASIRAAVKREFGLDSSVGIAPNKLLAKLASGRAKPNGVCTVLSGAEVAALLGALPAARMPGCGGKIGDTFAGAGIGAISDLQAWSEADMQSALGFPPDLAARLHGWARGRDEAAVAPRPPPKTLSVQMSLTPEPLPMHPSTIGQQAVAGSSRDMLHPLPVGAGDYRHRVGGVIAAMGADLLGRVLVDSEDEARWPGTLTLQLRFWGGGADNARFYTRSTAFPAPSLAGKPPPPRPACSAAPAGVADRRPAAASDANCSSCMSAGPAQAAPAAENRNTTATGAAAGAAAGAPLRSDAGPPGSKTAPSPGAPLLAHLAEHRASGRAVGAPPADALEAALRANAEGLCRSASSLQPPAAVLVEVRLLATGFTAAGAAAGPSIRQFLTQPPAAKRQRVAGGSGGADACDSTAASGKLGRPQLAGPVACAATVAHARLPQKKPAAASAADRGAACGVVADGDALDHMDGSASPVSTLTPPDEDAHEYRPEKHRTTADGAGPDVDLEAVDVAEQRRILRQLEADMRRQESLTAAAKSSRGMGRVAGGRGRQRSIADAFRQQRRPPS